MPDRSHVAGQLEKLIEICRDGQFRCHLTSPGLKPDAFILADAAPRPHFKFLCKNSCVIFSALAASSGRYPC
jgi:hypothetical protein